ncbi:TolB family protein [Mucilaginibacter pedocola]|uniref:DUF4157 domain-containing protein n=1 Tax=Mucilaginibacter pedocola TaxID=1792845 RepID=A0A1S9PIZ0_9SPHI|nr:hypothetical protein [Mucilaginibacter pedocola]OOQ60899.1 hypothetical protein BC343_23335 [Mucilaginibacter pedocola]
MKKLLLPLLLITATAAKAQQFGGNPPSIKWKQVNTPETKVIYPQGMDSAAQRVANIIQYITPKIKPSLGYRQKQISIVLQNQTTISNAYVGLAPFRSEFYLTPSQNSFELGSLYWPGQLAIHEFRHVQQYNNFNVGLSHALRVVFGEGGQALGNDLSIPNWFFEGDAVYNETLVSQQGRGRLPYFYNGFRALWAANKNYSWMKLRNGSYVDYIPNHYPLGYMMVAYGREKYGSDFWGKVTHDAASYKTGFYPFQTAIKKYSGKNYRSFRDGAFDHFKKQFANDDIVNDNAPKHFVADQEYPAFVNDSTLIYLKTRYNHIPEFVLSSQGKERTIAAQSINMDNYFTYHDGKVVYAAYRPDLRWGYRIYSELVVLDINTGREQRITRKTKYFSPAFSGDGKTIVAVDVEPSGKSALHLLDAETGKLLSAIPNTEKLFYTYPKFYAEDKIVSAVRNGKGEMALASVDTKSGAVKYFTPFSFEPIGFITVADGRVVFSKTTGAYDKLFILSLKSGKVYLKDTSDENMSPEIGAYQPAVFGSKMAWVGFTPYGYTIRKGTLSENDINETPLREAEPLTNMGIDKLEKDSATNLLPLAPNTALPVTKYSKAHGLFNFHSIFPNINDPNYSLELAGENVLNTFQSRVAFNYNRDEGYKRIGYTGIYGALFPYLSAGANYTFDRKGFYKGESIYFNETDLHGGFEIPLNFTGGKTITFLSAGSDVYYSQRRFQQAFRSRFEDSHYTYLNNYISFSNEIQQAKQQINPRLAQAIYLNYKTAIAGLSATQFLANGSFYFPGLGINHSLVISGAFQQKGKDNSIGFSNDFPFSKGFTAESLDKMQKFGASYHFPIAYPDAGFANLAYLLRVRGYLFYDHTHATDGSFLLNGKPFNANFRSAGAALFFDGKIFNQAAISFGIRYSHLLDDDLFGGNGRNRIELVLPVSIF